MSAQLPFPSDDSIAVVGAACRLPGGINSLADLWAVLVTGRDMVGEVPADRFPAGDFVDETRRRPGQSYTAAGGFLHDIYGFDASYFTGISPREASRMDPQQRLLLEMAVEALDDAGIDSTALEGTDTSVFIGCSSRDYGELQAHSPESGNAYTVTGMAGAIVANRLSHFFDWRGQSVMVDTACSSALTAVHQACEHLKAGHSRVAVAGGVNVLINPQGFSGFSAASMLSPTGRCRAFSAQADGFVRAEGGGLVLLKRLSDARADGDRIHGVILGSGTNNDGRTPGLALPSASAQQALLRDVYDRAGVLPDDLAYLEAHGTGTPVGDPLECEAVGRVLGRGRSTGALPIGSVKTNVGHLEAASGIAGLLKALLVLKHRQIPASLHGEQLNPSIDFTELNVHPVTRPQPLAHDGLPLAGVNSFGFGGANAHVILAASAPNSPGADKAAPDDSTSHRALPVVVSARTDQALRVACQEMAQHLQFTTDPFYDVAFTATMRRHHHERRVGVLAASAAEAADALLSLAPADDPGHSASVTGRPGKVAFVFSGNGSQWPGMGTDLLRTEPVFRTAVEAVDAELSPQLGWSVLDELTADAPCLARTEVAQPLLFAFQVGLLRLLASYGVEPDAVAGHSVGEIAAAYASGCLNLRQACQVVVARSTAQAATAGTGRMAACGLGPKEAEKELAAYHGRIEMAGINSDHDVTLAGHAEALADLGRQLTAREVFFRELDLDYAFHSRAMDPIRQELTGSLLPLRPACHQRTFVSSVTGDRLEGSRLDADYWWRNVREPVRFAEAVRALADSGCTQFVEIGPHAVLAGYLRRLVGAEATVPLCRREQDAPASIRRGAARVIAVGARPHRCFPRAGTAVSLPSYPFQREHCRNGQPDWWVAVPQDKTLRHPLLGRRAAVAEPTWHQLLSTNRVGWLTDHQVDGSIVMPGACYIEAFLAAGRAAFSAACEVTDLDIVRPLTLPDDDDPTSVTIQTSLSEEDGLACFASRTTPGGDWTLHARGRVRRLLDPAPQAIDPAAVRSHLSGPVIEAATHYDHAERAGLAYGPAFQVLTALYVGDGETLAVYRLPLNDHEPLEAHPVILDGALQTSGPLLAAAADGKMFLPTAVAATRVWRSLPSQGLVHVRLRDLSGSDALVDITIAGEDGTVCAELTGCRMRGVEAAGRKPAPVQELTHTLRAADSTPLPFGVACLWPDPEETVTATAAQRRELEARHPDGYADFAPQVKTAVGHWAAAAFTELLPRANEFGIDDLLAAGVRPQHGRYLRLLARLAERAGLLRAVTVEGEDRWCPTGAAQPHEQTQQLVDRFPEWVTAVAVYVRCGRHLTDILTGRADPRELLFTEADRHLVEGFYSDTPQVRMQARHASVLLARMLRDWPKDRPLRVLEVGAGTGGLTAHLLPLLPAPLTTYVYSDISAAFFPRAGARFADFDFVTYRTLDINTNAWEQGFTPGSFDLIVASNVLHATQDLRASCGRIAELLAPGGQLLAVESHDTDILGPCFGLLEDFWAFTDTDVRSSPLLDRDSWPAVLRAGGFDTTAQTGSAQSEADQDYSVLLARRAEPGTAAVPPARAAGHWVIVTADRGDVKAQHLGRALTAAGATSVRITDGVAQQPLTTAPPPVGVVALLCQTAAADDAVETVTGNTELIRTAAALCTPADDGTSALWVVTGPTGLFHSPEHTDEASPVYAAAWGVGRVLGNERPLLKVRRVSLHPSGDVDQDTQRLIHELLHADDEDEVVLAGGGRFTPRVATLPPVTRTVRAGDHYALRLERPGHDPVVTWTATDAPVPAPGEVVVQVRAAALNYRDVMLAQGMLPPGAEPATGTAPRLGLECAGDVVAVGPDVASLHVGDRVYAFAHGALASHVTVRLEQTGSIPDHLTYAEAATLPAVYLTVQHSLERCAGLRAGETLLVHGGAGGIGLAALSHARHVGARVVATAGSPAKRDLLRALGVEDVLNSRDLSFAHDVRRLTGSGVDVVLNSLAGEAIGRSLECLRPGGRFVELGKRDIYANSPLLLRPFRANLSYHAVDITRLIVDTPAEAAAAFATVTRRITDGTYRPLPHRAYPADRVAEALSSLRHSRHLGKVVITFSDTEPVEVHQPVGSVRLDPAATYLITGGLSGLGAATARHLADRGARHLALIGRRGATSPEASALLEDLSRRGAQATALAADVTDRQAITRIIREAAEQGRPVRGVVHAAMQLDDAPLDELTPDRVRQVLAAKVRGAQILDEADKDCVLDFFVTYSSVAALVGNLHQAPYAAANLYLESLMRRRRAQGRPGLALAWGGISDTGYVARTLLADTIARSGIGLISPRTAMDALDRHLALATEAAVTVGVMDWERLAHILPALTGPRFSAQLIDVTGTTTPQAADGLRQRLKKATNDTERITVITDALTAIAADILQTSPDRVSTTANLTDLGLDSLMGAELKVQLQRAFGCEFPLMELMGAATLAGVAQRLDVLVQRHEQEPTG